MQEFLRKQYLAKYPIILNNCDLSGVKAARLYMPYVKAESSIIWNAEFQYSTLRFADFQGADLAYTDFSHAELEHADFRNANLHQVNFKHANLYFADFRGANFDSTQLLGADLVLADLRGVKNLEKSFNLRCPSFAETKMTSREESIIKHISGDGKLFDVES